MANPTTSTTADIRTYLTFRLQKDLFAIDVLKVREVVELTSITPIPGSPKYMRGVINLRGNVVSVVDMRRKFGMAEIAQTIDTCIVVLDIQMDGEEMILGILVDAVQEVFELSSSQIEPPPTMGTRFKAEYLTGIGKSEDHFIMILDIDKMLSAEELMLVKNSEETVEEN